MSQTTQDDIIAAAMTLPPDVKVKLAEKLLDSAEPIDQKQIDALWVIEIRRRLQDLEEGRAHTIPAEEVFRSLDARLNREG
jgi:putative addiction module component (TIGR02574 family)